MLTQLVFKLTINDYSIFFQELEYRNYFRNEFRAAVDQLVESSAPDRRAGVQGSPGENCHVRSWHLVNVKSVVGAMFPKFLSKLYLWGFKSEGATPTGAHRKCNGMSPDLPSG